ncbi:MAG: hypothetical protein MUO91_09965 [candidate division Zixibacteria bacterium]|nr:hypothetical protein [candidate division Zixibacteria bacterium]
MEGNNLIEIAKEAYVLAQQIAGMQETMNKSEQAVSGYPSYANNFNALLEKTKKILEVDQTILMTISHLKRYDPNLDTGYIREFEEIKANLPILKGALHSFFEFQFS